MRAALLLAILVAVPAAALDWIRAAGGDLRTNERGDAVEVRLRGGWVTDADMDALAGMPSVETIDLSHTRVSDLGLLRLRNLKNVRELNLFYAELVTDEGVAAVKEWPRLERLNLRGTKITDNTLAMLAEKKTLRSLDVGMAEVTDSGMQNLAALTELRELSFGGNKLTEVSLAVLKALPKIERLDMSGRQRTDSGLWFLAITDVGLDPVARLSELRWLNLSGTPVSPRGLEKLRGLGKLETLKLTEAKRVTDDAVPHLAAMKSLRWVDVKDSGLTEKGIAELRRVRPDCQVVR
jgi:hypothetical protein